jgi:hypothetical protein
VFPIGNRQSSIVIYNGSRHSAARAISALVQQIPDAPAIRRTAMKLTPGKLAGMKAVSDKRGVIAAAAMDQRGSLQKSLAKEKGADVGDREMEEFKSLVTEVLTKHASAILLDPEWGLPA